MLYLLSCAATSALRRGGLSASVSNRVLTFTLEAYEVVCFSDPDTSNHLSSAAYVQTAD